MPMIQPTYNTGHRRKTRVWMLQYCMERGTGQLWEVEGERDQKERKEGEEIRLGVSGTGDLREVQRIRKLTKKLVGGDDILGIATGGSHTPEKREAPRTQQGQQ